MDNIRSTASSTARNIADSIEPSNGTKDPNDTQELRTDEQKMPLRREDFRNQLDKAAFDNVEEVKTEESTIQKGMGVPNEPQSQASQESKEEGKESEMNSGAAPKRPDHDLQIEEFLKEHYKSGSKP